MSRQDNNKFSPVLTGVPSEQNQSVRSYLPLITHEKRFVTGAKHSNRERDREREREREYNKHKFKLFKKACYLFSPFFYVAFSYTFGLMHVL